MTTVKQRIWAYRHSVEAVGEIFRLGHGLFAFRPSGFVTSTELSGDVRRSKDRILGLRDLASLIFSNIFCQRVPLSAEGQPQARIERWRSFCHVPRRAARPPFAASTQAPRIIFSLSSPSQLYGQSNVHPQPSRHVFAHQLARHKPVAFRTQRQDFELKQNSWGVVSSCLFVKDEEPGQA
jgi:hypothetical protein